MKKQEMQEQLKWEINHWLEQIEKTKYENEKYKYENMARALYLFGKSAELIESGAFPLFEEEEV